MLAAAGAAVLAIWLTTAWLLDVADDAPPGTERAKIRVDAVRTGLAAGGGAGAAVGLMLAFRRQRHAELATALGQLDAAERRITELYNAAAEQLGSDKAPVRLTALYTLERLANDNPRHQQTIVNIICAYLRMPYTPPPADGPDQEEQHRERARRNAARYRAARDNRPAPLEPAPHGADPHEERQVRLTAERLLATHLRPDAEHHWNGVSLDLTGATLTDLDLALCAVQRADFSNATFSGDAEFGYATFSGNAEFRGATFSGDAWFDHATFSGNAEFGQATFSGIAGFGRTTFSRHAGFDQATFSSNASFGGAPFSSNASFVGATFSRHAIFGGAAFSEHAGFGQATFSSNASFGGATFSRDASFGEATFGGDAWFGEATFGGDVRFDEARFEHTVVLESATVAVCAAGHVPPPGWRIEPTEGGAGRFSRDPAPANGI
ncbi:pentapeptide repeat-containing protein [Actinomadura chibensis]|uniref:Pentapeptide repeat-containing protein n=1 Tax=Actinomadura chibensis TaxID=392828 RepID=A0A5D0NTJ6_9ACTN|nr:pentapeptide repeat-containing protein [Actinomadura chibensis]TYB47786.1 pentapeptide repeat-containing protein [Actinomadura chibensis]